MTDPTPPDLADPVSGDLTREALEQGGRLWRWYQDACVEHNDDSRSGEISTARLMLSGWFFNNADPVLAAASRDLASRSEERPGLSMTEERISRCPRCGGSGSYYETRGLDNVGPWPCHCRLASRDRQAEGLSEEKRAWLEDLRRAWIEARPTYPGDRAVDDIFDLFALLDAHFPPPAPTPVLREEEA